MKGLVFDTENRIQLKDFGEPLLDNLQKEVGGYIEVVHPRYLPEGLCMVVDDEGLLKGSPVNNIASIHIAAAGLQPADAPLCLLCLAVQAAGGCRSAGLAD